MAASKWVAFVELPKLPEKRTTPGRGLSRVGDFGLLGRGQTPRGFARGDCPREAGAAVAKKEPMEQPKPLRFEEALKRLGELVQLLEEGEIGLDEALQRYEEGVKLLRQAYELLTRAERRIELLSGVDAEGNPICEPFDDRATLLPQDDAEPDARRPTEDGR
jgi:exodeoxyribonuclease VII small subunit